MKYVLIMLAFIVIILIIKKIFKASKSTASQASAEAVTVYNEADPNEILVITKLLSTIAANADDSHIGVVLQDENPFKGWPKVMSIGGFIDNSRGDVAHNTASYIKYGLSPADAKYLSSVPLNITGTGDNFSFNYEFTSTPECPSQLSRLVEDAMRQGVQQCRYSSRRFEINNKGQSVYLTVR